MQKKEFLEHLKSLATKTISKIPFGIIPYKHKGSTFDEDGVRITGSPEFINAVLIRLGATELLSHENTSTRLQCMYTASTDRKTGNPTGSYVCYVQVHQRGHEAQIANAIASNITGKETIISKSY